jgi:hypothetical protein
MPKVFHLASYAALAASLVLVLAITTHFGV